MEAKGKGYIIRDSVTGRPEKLSFGNLYVLTSQKDFGRANVAYAVITKPDSPHYHDEATEFYFICEGIGRIKLNGKEKSIRKGQLIMIKPGTIHCAAPVGSPADLEILIVSVPAYTSADESHALYHKKYGFEGEEDL